LWGIFLQPGECHQKLVVVPVLEEPGGEVKEFPHLRDPHPVMGWLPQLGEPCEVTGVFPQLRGSFYVVKQTLELVSSVVLYCLRCLGDR
jgi:hypothetical protein